MTAPTPTGFFNCEFYVGLKPYSDKSWKGENDTKEKLIEADQQEIDRVSRNHL